MPPTIWQEALEKLLAYVEDSMTTLQYAVFLAWLHGNRVTGPHKLSSSMPESVRKPFCDSLIKTGVAQFPVPLVGIMRFDVEKLREACGRHRGEGTDYTCGDCPVFSDGMCGALRGAHAWGFTENTLCAFNPQHAPQPAPEPWPEWDELSDSRKIAFSLAFRRVEDLLAADRVVPTSKLYDNLRVWQDSIPLLSGLELPLVLYAEGRAMALIIDDQGRAAVYRLSEAEYADRELLFTEKGQEQADFEVVPALNCNVSENRGVRVERRKA